MSTTTDVRLHGISHHTAEIVILLGTTTKDFTQRKNPLYVRPTDKVCGWEGTARYSNTSCCIQHCYPSENGGKRRAAPLEFASTGRAGGIRTATRGQERARGNVRSVGRLSASCTNGQIANSVTSRAEPCRCVENKFHHLFFNSVSFWLSSRFHLFAFLVFDLLFCFFARIGVQ